MTLENSCCSMFNCMKIDPPSIFSDLVKRRVKPIATKSRFQSKSDLEFMKAEVNRLFQEGIIEESRSPWRS